MDGGDGSKPGTWRKDCGELNPLFTGTFSLGSGVMLNLNSAVFGHFRRALIAIRGACLLTPLRSPGTSSAAVMS